MVPYLNGELGRRRRSKIERHLEKCSGCMYEYQLEKRMENLLTSEMRNSARESDPLLTWDNLRQSLEREAIAAKGASRWTRIEESWLTDLKEIALPKAARTLSEVSYWGKRVAVPATIMILAVLFYHTFQTSTYTPETTTILTEARAPVMIRVNFGPDKVASNEGYYTDRGGIYSTCTLYKSKLKYGWLQKEKRRSELRDRVSCPDFIRT